MNDSAENTLEKKFRTAVKQLKHLNKNHAVPNVIAFVNLNNMVNAGDLHIALTGYSVTEDGKYIYPKIRQSCK